MSASMQILDLFAQISPDGEIFYTHFWNVFFERIFCWNFPLFWIAIISIWKVSRFFKWRGIFPSSKWVFARKSLWLVPFIVMAWFFLNKVGGVPHFEDEFSNLYQARTVSTGTYPGVIIPSELSKTFQTGFLIKDSAGRLVGPYPIGFPLVLALLDLIGVLPWAALILGAANIWIFFRLCRACFSFRRWFPPLLLTGSPFFILHSTFLFSQSLALLLINIVLLRRTSRENLWPDYLIASFLFLARPLDGLILFTSLLLWQLFVHSERFSSPIWFLFFLPIHFFHQKIQTGFWTESTYHLSQPFFNLGYGSAIGVAIPFGFNLKQAFENLGLTLVTLNETLWGWPACSLFPIIGFLLKTRRTGWHHAPVFKFSLLLAGVWFFSYFHLFYPGVVIGPRYHQPLLGFFFLISCRFLFSLRYWRPIMGFACLIALVQLFSHPVENAGGVLSFPLKNRELKSGFVYIVPKKNIGVRDIFRSFYQFNDPFNWKALRFLHPEDLENNRKWCQDIWGTRLMPLPTVEITSQKSNSTTCP